MSQNFLNGMTAEKARAAHTLIAEILDTLPNELHERYHDGLQAGAAALKNLQHELRGKDTP